MARMVNPNQDIDPENAAVLSGAPRTRGNIRQGAMRQRMQRKRKDKFHVPPEAIPKGWVVEWKRKNCLGRPEEPDYQMDLADGGWKYADPKMFPMLMPEGHESRTIERGGMVLMIRPAHMKKESLQLDHEEAVGQVRDKLRELGMTAEGELPRRVQGFQREYEGRGSRMIPDDDGEDASYEGSDQRPNQDE